MVSTKSLVARGLVLFTLGVVFSLVLNLLQVQRQVTVFPPEVLASVFSSAWWVAPSCGTAAGKWKICLYTRSFHYSFH
jgi:hypothetical protein